MLCNHLLNLLLEENKINQMELVFAEMRKGKTEPNTVTCIMLINGFCKNCQMKDALLVLDEMSRKDIPMNERILNT